MGDRKSTRLNSSHLGISYAVFCLKKKIAQNEVDYICMRSATDTVMYIWVLVRAVVSPHTDQKLSCYRVHGAGAHSGMFFFNDAGTPGVLPFSPERRSPV